MSGHSEDHTTLLAGLPTDVRQTLTRKSDLRGLVHLTAHVGLVLLLCTWIGLGLAFWPLAIWPLGIALAFLFTLQHECTHATPFRARWLSEAVGRITGVILVQPFHWFRVFHLAHHRHTNDPERDPELQGDAKPETWPALIWYLSTLGYWRDKVRSLGSLAMGAADAEYIPPKARPRIVAEARVMVVIYAAAALFTVFVSPILFWVWLLPLVTGFPLLRLYLLAEHARCPAVTNMLENTRTTLTNRIVRFLAWNMPYHAEHHAYPAVPFHKLPALHAHTRNALKSVSPGYRNFTRNYAAGLSEP